MVNNLPAMQEMWVQSLGWEDPLMKGMVTHSSILAWRISQTEKEPGGLLSMGSQKVGHSFRQIQSIRWNFLLLKLTSFNKLIFQVLARMHKKLVRK